MEVRNIFYHPDYTVGIGIAPIQPHSARRYPVKQQVCSRSGMAAVSFSVLASIVRDKKASVKPSLKKVLAISGHCVIIQTVKQLNRDVFPPLPEAPAADL